MPKRLKIRKRWTINPRTRVKESEKKYKRSRAKRNLKRLLKEQERRK